MHIITPIVITDAMLDSSTIAEPDTGETSWVSGGTYALLDQRIRTTTHRIYECIQAHTGRTALPENDPLYWEDAGPTNKWAAFDTYVNTASTSVTSVTYVLSPGFFDSIAFFGLVGSSMQVTVKDAPGGATVFTQTYSLYEQAVGLYEYLFRPSKQRDKLVITDIPLRPTAELTVVISNAVSSPVACGMMSIGYKSSLAIEFGGTQYGSSAEPVTYSRITTDEFGTTRIIRGHKATGMRAEVVVALSEVNNALKIVQDVLDIPVTWVATNDSQYSGLQVFGLGSASVSYEGPSHCKISINVKGLI